MKACSRCKQHKDGSDFYPTKWSADGLFNQCRVCAGLSAKESYERCRVARIANVSSWYLANKDKKREYDKKRREEKRHLYRAASKRWRDTNPGAKNADTQSRRARLLGAYPSWANKFFIEEIYDLAARRTKATGFSWVVDHEIPLRGRNVCGLHVETNLRVIPEVLNLTKSNHYSMTDGGIK